MIQSPAFISTFVSTSVRLPSLSLTLRPADEFNSLGSFHSHFFFVSLYDRTNTCRVQSVFSFPLSGE